MTWIINLNQASLQEYKIIQYNTIAISKAHAGHFSNQTTLQTLFRHPHRQTHRSSQARLARQPGGCLNSDLHHLEN